MRVTSTFLVLLALGAPAARGGDPPPLESGQSILAADFDGEDPFRSFAGRAGAVALEAGHESRHAAALTARPGGAAPHLAASLPAARCGGAQLLVCAWVKAEGVSARPNPWNGIKVMVPIETEGGERLWPQATIGVGTFGWRHVCFSMRVPRDVRMLSLVLGLEQVTGKVWFDDVRITVRRLPRAVSPAPPAGPRHKGHTLPRLRGAMVSTEANADDLRVLGREWNANLIRWQLCEFRPRIDTSDLAAYDAFLEEHLQKLDAALPGCAAAGLLVVVDLHTGPGHWGESGQSLFTNRKYQDRFVEIWEHIARRYKAAPAVWGYDLLNEPLEEGAAEGVADWQELAERAARAIRRIDPDRTIIVEPAPWGGPTALENLEPLDVPRVVYSVHMYMPHAFTHQGVNDRTQAPIRYPGPVEGRHWDAAALERALAPVIAFQERHNVHIYIGEFSAIRWAPDGSGARYLADCIEIFERRGWDWTYHAFREWSGWSVEHSDDPSDPRPAAAPTERKKLLLRWFAKDEKPGS
jgi:hypothetical protein